DNFINKRMIEGCFFAKHIYVHTSGKSALEFLKNLESMGNGGRSAFPKIIFLDINMPIMDGYQFITEFEKLPKELIRDSRIVLLTTSLNPDDIEKSKKISSVSKFINKPLTPKILESL
ncbi:MAG TPA: response regulator, partial [Bacteroidia bacterium]